ncbi:MAG: alpha-galactosidase [Rhodothermaceae bacterium]|nr:alpha-galactosidase [Rhodothermaceae bacterium]
MLKKLLLIILVLITSWTLAGCGKTEPVVETSQFRLEFNDLMHSRIISKTTGSEMEFSGFSPSEYLIVDGTEVRDFELDKVTKSGVDDRMGGGTTFTLTGTNGAVEKTVTVRTYDNFPNTAVFDVTYRNTGNDDLVVDVWVNNHYRIANSASGYEYPFWSYQSESTSHRNDWVLPVSAGFSQQNYMGMNNSDYGGGTPVSSLWRPDGGLAVGHLEMVPKLVKIPVSMETAENADIHIRYDKGVELPAGGSFETFTTFVRVQEGDYFATLVDYKDMMVKRGISFPEINDSAYETQWCAWGYERTFTMEQVYGTLPKVGDLEYHWVVLDDGWQTNVGDWALHPDKYPAGDADMQKFVQTVHDAGFRSKLWWAPLGMHPDSDIYASNPEYLILDKDGEPVNITWWNVHYMCPAYQPVVDYHTDLVRTMMDTWGYEGLKIDGQHLNAAPECFNPAHNHARPEESHEAMPAFFKAIYDTGTSIVDDALIEICPCGTAYAFHLLPYMTQGVSSDPTSSWQVRHKGRTLKALMGRNTPFFGDHVELSRGGSDFASQVGTGAIIGTKFTWPVGAGPDPETDLTPERDDYWQKWADIYQSKRLAEGQYMGELYDIGFYRPETHAISKDDAMYYGFYADQNPGRDVSDIGDYDGTVELRGLQAGRTYEVTDYENNVSFGTVEGPVAELNVTFTNHLLLQAVPN